MKGHSILITFVAALSLRALAARAGVPPAANALTIFDTRSAFISAAGPLLTDDYEHPAYATVQPDDVMSGVKGLTQYKTTAFADFNEVIGFGPGRHVYAGGFTSGSFQMEFSAPALGGSGINSVGFDYLNNSSATPYVAFVSFADGSSQNFPLQTSPFAPPPLPDFFGLISSVPITSIDIGLPDGTPTSANLFTLDNLSVAAPVQRCSTAADCNDNDACTRDSCVNRVCQHVLDTDDADHDFVSDCRDACPGTVPGATVDAKGCPPLIPGDFDHDGDVDGTGIGSDFAHFQTCSTRSGVAQRDANCLDADLDHDGDVDLDDFGIFQRCFSGLGVPANPGCNR